MHGRPWLRHSMHGRPWLRDSVHASTHAQHSPWLELAMNIAAQAGAGACITLCNVAAGALTHGDAGPLGDILRGGHRRGGGHQQADRGAPPKGGKLLLGGAAVALYRWWENTTGRDSSSTTESLFSAVSRC
jgi:hypothetical protein